MEFPNALYHIISRGDRREAIYRDDEDRLQWLMILGQVCECFNWVIHGYCQMTNHYHILAETIDGNLSRGMRQLNGLYTQKFNNRYKESGHLFQGRYKAIIVQKESYRLQVRNAIPDMTLGYPALHLMQPLVNLVLNAQKHMHRSTGGWIKLSAQENPNRTGLVFRVEDNGPGIAARDEPNIFSAGYSQAPDPSERTGLGLYVSRLLAREIGGELTLQDNWRGYGCTFELNLPMKL